MVPSRCILSKLFSGCGIADEKASGIRCSPNHTGPRGVLCKGGFLIKLRILRLLFKERLSVMEISERLNASQCNISKHVRSYARRAFWRLRSAANNAFTRSQES